MRYARTTDIYPKIPKGPQGERYCRRCRVVLKGRTAWCSDECRNDAWIRSSPGTARIYVKQRDKGVCADCRTDTEALDRLWRDLLERARSWNRVQASRVWWSIVSRALRDCRTETWGRREHWWEADHITPVSEGGGLCGLDGYQTLCTRCHDRHSGELRSRLNRERKLREAAEPKRLSPITGPLFEARQ